MKTGRATVKAIGAIPPGHTPITVVDQVAVSIGLDPYLSLKALACYSALSRRTLQKHLSDPYDPIPSYRVGGKVLVRRSEFDAWMARRRNEKVQALTRLAAADAQALLTARPRRIP